ncbi:RNA-directed DNA polymerase, eukaryota, reverse transcriptase zinc-binding domain protein [Tanacetum coccineum]
MAWVKWPIILNSFDKGGLNIGSLKAFNLALLQKWRWRMFSSPNDLWVKVVKAFHGHEGGFDNNGCSFKVGYGTRIRFWKDIWVGEAPIFIRLNLSLRGMDIPAISCSSCNANVESANHIFFECTIASDMWKLVYRWCDIPFVQALSFEQPIENSRGPCTLNMGTCVWFYPTVVRGSSLTQWCNLDAMSYGHKVGFLQVVECQLDDALALSRLKGTLQLREKTIDYPRSLQPFQPNFNLHPKTISVGKSFGVQNQIIFMTLLGVHGEDEVGLFCDVRRLNFIGLIPPQIPVKCGEITLLSTSDQPFALEHLDTRFQKYIEKFSIRYKYEIDVNSRSEVDKDPLIISGDSGYVGSPGVSVGSFCFVMSYGLFNFAACFLSKRFMCWCC